jgi:membrane associated rhomboid family serine protease/tetratricopeptide (TPR) repeat protein
VPVCPTCGESFSGFSFGARPVTECPRCRIMHPQAPGPSTSKTGAPSPYEVLLRAGHIPVVTRTIIVLNVLVFLGMGISGASWIDPKTTDALRWGADFGVLSLSGQWWRLLTCMFVHFGVFHIALNMWCLWGLGPILERLMGSKAFAITYLCSGLAASEASLTWSPLRVSAGASGAIFGIAGAFFSFLFFKKAPIDKEFVQHRLKSLGAFILYNLFFGAVVFRVDNAAHVGGLVAGLILGAALPGLTLRSLSIVGLDQQQAFQTGDPVGDDSQSQGLANRRVLSIALVSAVVLIAAAFGIQKHYASIVVVGKAARLVRAGKPAVAILQLQNAIAVKPETQPLACEMLGILLLEQGDPIGAYPILEQAVEGDRNNRHLRHNLALAYIGASYPKAAVREVNWALQAPYEDRPAAEFILGLSAYLERNYDQASAHLLSAINGRKDFFEAQDALARVYIEAKRWEEARSLYLNVLSLHPSDPIANSGITFLGDRRREKVEWDDLPTITIPYSKLTAKSELWPYYP